MRGLAPSSISPLFTYIQDRGVQMSNPDTIVEVGNYWIYDKPPENASKKMLLLTAGKICILGPWHGTVGVIAWHPVPDRNKKLELSLGL